jgi:hypothetical protein
MVKPAEIRTELVQDDVYGCRTISGALGRGGRKRSIFVVFQLADVVLRVELNAEL